MPFTSKTGHLDASFGEVVTWFKDVLGIEDTQSIRITIVIDGVAYRALLSAAQLLGHTVGSLLGLGGAVDLDDSHDIVLIVSHSFLVPLCVIVIVPTPFSPM